MGVGVASPKWHEVPSLKLTAKAPENGWLEDDCFHLGCLIFRGYVSLEKITHMSKTVATHPWSTPQAIPLPNYERIPFTACWDRLRGVFQRCVETTLEHGISGVPKKKRLTLDTFWSQIHLVEMTACRGLTFWCKFSLNSALRFFSCEGWPLKKWVGKGRHNFIYLERQVSYFFRQLFTIALKIGHLAFQVSPKGLLRRCLAVQTPTQLVLWMSRQNGSDGLNPWSSRSIVSYGAAFSFWLIHPH